MVTDMAEVRWMFVHSPHSVQRAGLLKRSVNLLNKLNAKTSYLLTLIATDEDSGEVEFDISVSLPYEMAALPRSPTRRED